jgi:acetyltransferase-like isoleucine patch superfamily enzyme
MFKFKDSLLIGLLQGIPLSIGRKLRALLYRTILARLGNFVQIGTGVEFGGVRHIEIGNHVTIERDTQITSWYPKSRVILKDGVFLSRGVDIKNHLDGCIEIGEKTFIGNFSSLSGKNIKIGRYCLIAAYTGIFANNHIYTDPDQYIQDQGASYKGIVIGDDCWLGTGVKVVDGVRIGQGSVIGAGAVVTKDIPPYSIAVGVPAKIIGRRDGSKESLAKEQVLTSGYNGFNSRKL